MKDSCVIEVSNDDLCDGLGCARQLGPGVRLGVVGHRRSQRDTEQAERDDRGEHGKSDDPGSHRVPLLRPDLCLP